MKCFILINSSLNAAFKKRVASEIKRAAGNGPVSVICADSGAELAWPLVVPDLIIGDLDSISDNVRAGYESLGVRFERYPVEKDFTDFHLALSSAASINEKSESGEKVSSIKVFGGLGRRLDQTIANIYVAGCFQNETGIPVSIHENKTHVYIADPALGGYIRIDERVHALDTFSLRPLFEKTHIVGTAGLKYKVANETLGAFESRGTSNEADSKTVEVTVSEGPLLIIHIEK